MEELLVMEPIIAYRYWRVDNYADSYKLSGIVVDYTWGKGVNLAKCAKKCPPFSLPGGCESVPDFECDCGFYAYKTVNLAQNMLGAALHFHTSGYRCMYAFGEVELTGKVIEHQYGYRGEKAVVKRLAPGPFSRASEPTYGYYVAEKVSQYYEVPLVNIMEEGR